MAARIGWLSALVLCAACSGRRGPLASGNAAGVLKDDGRAAGWGTVQPPCPDEAPASHDALAAAVGRTRFAVVGDYGSAGEPEARVAALIASWRPDFVVTTGDNNYPVGGADTIDANIGQYYHQLIAPYRGQFGCGAVRNRFFPSLGNHDWYSPGARPYLDYFTLPGNERYYDVVVGHVHVFALDSDSSEPDGVTADSIQAHWLRTTLSGSTAPWRIVAFHHPPFSSGPHQSSPHMQWPFKEWGASVVFAGHDHDYERLSVDGLPYITSGLGGASLYKMGAPLPGSQARFDQNFGAVLVDATASSLTTQFFTTEGVLIDRMDLKADR